MRYKPSVIATYHHLWQTSWTWTAALEEHHRWTETPFAAAQRLVRHQHEELADPSLQYAAIGSTTNVNGATCE